MAAPWWPMVAPPLPMLWVAGEVMSDFGESIHWELNEPNVAAEMSEEDWQKVRDFPGVFKTEEKR